MVDTPSARSYGFIAIAILGWGLSTSFIEAGLKHIDPFPFLAWRFIIAVLFLTPFILIFRRKEVVDLVRNKWTWAIGLSEAAGLMFQYLGQERKGADGEAAIPAGLAALLSLMFLLIVPFFSKYLLNEKLNPKHGIAMIIGFIGVILISSKGDLDNIFGNDIVAISLLLLAAVSYALYIVTTSRLTTIEKKDVDTFALFYLILLIITLISTLSSAAVSTTSLPNESALQWIIMLAIFSTIIAFFAYFEALKEISANTASVLLLLQVLVPFTIDYTLLGRSYGIWVISGSLFILISMIIVVMLPYLEERQLEGPHLPVDTEKVGLES